MTASELVRFNRALPLGRELEYVAEALQTGAGAGDGAWSRRCEGLLETLTGAARVLLMPSCTHALELAALLLDIQPGEEVIVPAFTFPSTATAFALRGARVVFADSRPDTLNLDETQIERLITPRTRALVAMHYAGVGCAMEALVRMAHRHHLALVEDNAHGLFGFLRTTPLGAFGALATLSFHETKNIACGEGGALVVNDPALVERAEILRHKGTDRARFLRGAVDRYTWVDLGSSGVLAEPLAAFLYGQLEARTRIQVRRMAIWRRYQDGLTGWADAAGARLPVVPADCQPSGAPVLSADAHARRARRPDRPSGRGRHRRRVAL